MSFHIKLEKLPARISFYFISFHFIQKLPAVVLGAELEVAHDDADFRTGDGEDEHDRHQETEDEVQLLLPDGRHHEDELHQDSPKGENAGERNRHLFMDNKHTRTKEAKT